MNVFSRQFRTPRTPKEPKGPKGPKVTKAPGIDRQRSLASIPALNPGVRTTKGSDGRLLVTVTIPRRAKGFLARFQPAVSERRVRLDELGEFVLSRIDGMRSVADIVATFVEKYGTTYREAELCTAEFLKSLAQRSIISIGVR